MRGIDLDGNNFNYDCREEQTPTRAKAGEWAVIRELEVWEDDEIWEKYGDYYKFWDERTDIHHGYEDWNYYDDYCEDHEVEMSSEVFGATDRMEKWEMSLVYNHCGEEPVKSCSMKGVDANGERVEYDCKEEQTPAATEEKIEAWEEVREWELWEDEEIWDQYGDYYMLWDRRTGVINEVWDEEYEIDYEEEYYACDEFCEWEKSEYAQNYDEEWDDETKAEYWNEKSEATGCDPELICEFYECTDTEVDQNDAQCWHEECNSDCGQYECAVWHYDFDTEIWTTEECEDEVELEDFQQTAGQAAEIIQTYDGTARKALEMFCATDNCLGEVVGEIDLSGVDTSLLQNQEIKNVASTLVNDMGEHLGADTDLAEFLLKEDTTPDQVAEVAKNVIQETIGEGWLSDLFGSFVEGAVNDGMERKGERDDD